MRTFNFKTIGLIGGVFGGIILGVPIISSTALAAPSPRLNPCPRIYYEEPYNSRLIVPQDCPPNAITQSTLDSPGAVRRGVGAVGGDSPSQVLPTNRPSIFNESPYNRGNRSTIAQPAQPPLPEQRSQPIAKVIPTDGTIDVRLKNNTNAAITYEAVQQTQRRVLRAGEEVVLQNVPVPMTLTFVRQDNGFVEVVPTNASEQGLLSLSLDEDATPRDRNQGVIRVQRDGQVFLH